MKQLITVLSILVLGCSNIPNEITVDIIDDINSTLLSNAKNSNNPIVIVVPGSGGNQMPKERLYGLVQSGHDVLSITYVGKKDLPNEIELVPLEYLKNIVLWTKSKFKKRKIVLLGISKGAEYVLTFASHFNLIDGLICYSPSAFVIPNHVSLKQGESQKSSWTINNKEIPFASLDKFNDKAGMITYKKYIDPIFNKPKELNKSRIRVENIKCKILLLSGEDDLVWPSSKMSNYIKSEILKHDLNFDISHVSYKSCGHQFVWFNENKPEFTPEYQSMNLTGIKKHKFLFGGAKEATIEAMINSRITVIDFLNNI